MSKKRLYVLDANECPADSCFTLCRKKCIADSDCVAFQCDSSNSNVCKLSHCAQAALTPTAMLSCYLLADAARIEPAL